MSHMDARSGQYRYIWSEEYKEMPFSIEMAGVDRCAPQYYLRRSPASISVIGYTMKGAGVIVQNGNLKKAEVGSLFMVNIGEEHEYYPSADWEFCWVNIRGDYWRELLVKYGLEKEIVFEGFEQGAEFLELIRSITNDMEDLDMWQLDMQSFLFENILRLYMLRRGRQEKSLAYRIRNAFERNIDTGKNQDEICRMVGITSRHAQRVFKEEYKLSIHQFVEQKKLQKSKALLLNTDKCISWIAQEVGFENEKYFSTFFRKKEGMSPSDFRKCHW